MPQPLFVNILVFCVQRMLTEMSENAIELLLVVHRCLWCCELAEFNSFTLQDVLVLVLCLDRFILVAVVYAVPYSVVVRTPTSLIITKSTAHRQTDIDIAATEVVV